MEENEIVPAPPPNFAGEEVVKKVKKRIDMVKTAKSQIETVRMSARQAERKAKSSRDNSEENKADGEESITVLNKMNTDLKEMNKNVEAESRMRPGVIINECDLSTDTEVPTVNFERQENNDLLDDLVMDFGDEELEEDPGEDLEEEKLDMNINSEGINDKMVDDIAGEVAGELTEEKEAEAELSEPDIDDEENELPVDESDDDYGEKPPAKPVHTAWVPKEKIWKYGKLWEFIRDLMKIPRYNPSVIRWENEDEGEFRIVDSGTVARLWATVKGNKKMNYEKLSRAMRYYYKHKVFEIVPNKRLVYKFGSRAYNWRKQELEKPGALRIPCPSQGRRRTTWRCGECLRMFQSSLEHERHSTQCQDTLQLPEDQSKKDAEKLRSHLASRTQSLESARPICNNKPLREKLTELKSKLAPDTLNDKEAVVVSSLSKAKPPTLAISSESTVTPASKEKTTFETSDSNVSFDLTVNSDEEVSSPIRLVIDSPPLSQTKYISTKEHDAVHSLMCLGGELETKRTEEKTNSSSPTQLPLTVSEINKKATEVSLSPPLETDSNHGPAKNYIVIPNFAALTGALPHLPAPPPTPPTTVPDKISFLKSAAEKSKTHTFLQRRGDVMLQSPRILALTPEAKTDHGSEDEVEVVKIVKTPQVTVPEKDLRQLLTAIDSRIQSKSPNSLEQNKSPMLSPSIHEQAAIPPPPSFSDSVVNTRIVNVNPKYTRAIEERTAVEEGGPVEEDVNGDLDRIDEQNNLETKENNLPSEGSVLEKVELQMSELGGLQKLGGVSVGTLRMTQYQYIDFLPNQSPVVEESDNLLTETVTETAPPPPPPVSTAPVESPLPQRSSLIRINPKYSRVLTDNTENIAAPEDDTKAKSRSTESPTSSGRSIKINPKYANIAGGPIIPQPRPMISVNPQYQGLGNINTKITDDGKASVLKGGDLELQRVKTQVEVMNTKANRLSDIIAESNSSFKLSKTSRETEPLRTSDGQNISKNRFKRAAEMLMPSKQAKRSRLSENLENLRRHTADSSSLVSSLGSAPTSSIPRRYSDRIDRITGPVPALPTFMTKERPQEAVEPLPGLWKFLRALLHSPAYNPKIVNWEILEEGMFRIHNLSNFYTIWKELKKTDINYDLLTKSIKIYDEKKVLHAVYNHRCVYKFGQNASDWKPSDLEIILICRKPVPNPATWHTSRFYGDLEQSSSSLPPTTTTTETSSSSPVSAPTTLFTLTPLDSSSTQLSEMKVMSDHSRIITTNNFSATLPSGSVPLSPPAPPPPLSVKSCTDAMAEIKIESIADEVTDEKIETKNIEHMEDLLQPKVEDIEVDCSLILPHQSDLKAVLRLPGGFNIHLDRSLFKDVESSQAFKNIYSGKNVKTTIVPRDRSLSFRTGGRNKVLSRSKSQMKPMMENPLTIAQLMDTMIPKKLNSILPKVDLAPGGEVLRSSSGGCQEDTLVGGLPGGSERKGDSRMERSKNFVSLPVSVLERNATIEEQAVSLHLPEVPMADISRPIMITTSTPSGHRLPSLVTQLPSTLVSPSHLPSITLSPTNTLATVSSVPPLRSHSSLPIRPSVSLQKPSIQPISTVPSTMIPVPVLAPGITHSPGPIHGPDVSLSQILTPVHSQAFSHNLVPATITQASDVNNDSAQLILNDDERQLELNKNVLRCRNYRDRKKNMMRQGEEERFFLTTRNSRLKGKEARLLNATTKLKMFLLRMIRENRYKCCGKTARV